MKSIKKTILFSMILTIAVSLLFVGSITLILNYKNIITTLQQTMTESVKLASERVSYEIKSYKNIAMDTGRVARLSDPAKTIKDKQDIINQAVDAYDLKRGNILGKDGISLFDGKDYSDREYFKQSMQGHTYISEPLISQITGELSMIVSAPLWKGGIPDTEIVGVVYFVPPETFLNDIVASIKISENAEAFILDSNGTTIAAIDKNTVTDGRNTIRDAQTDKSFSSLASLEQRMTQGETGFDRYTYGKSKMFLSFAPIEEGNNWSLGISCPQRDYLYTTRIIMIITVLCLIAACFAAAVVAFWLANRIGKPIKACADRIELLANGDLKTAVPQVKTKDEVKTLAQATEKIVSNMNGIINDMSWGLGEMAKGNFNIESHAGELYVGDFAPMAQSMYEILNQLTNTLIQINQSADQVADGSTQVASGAQAFSQSAVEQASSVQELAATIDEISVHVNQNAESAEEASKKVSSVGKEMLESNQQMQAMIDAISEISDTSNEISKIMKTIEDIAFQTNILALNASVEAARAGAAGKGFAVVADEVSNLANKASQASKNTSELIQSSIEAVENGTIIANATADFLHAAVEGVNDVVDTINKISAASNEQAQSIMQVTQGVDQISSVIQTNSATAEESAATSEQLSAQAQTLKNLIEQFQLKRN